VSTARLPRGSRAVLTTSDGQPLKADAAWVAFDACLVSAEPGATEDLWVNGLGQVVTGRWRTIIQQVSQGHGAIEFERRTDGPANSALLVSTPRLLDMETEHPTVILITSDTHRADHVSTINPGSPVSTPHIDKLGSEARCSPTASRRSTTPTPRT